jgi:hypothetical protein
MIAMVRGVTQFPMNLTPQMKLQKIQRYSALFRTLLAVLFVPVVVITLAAAVATVAGWTAHISHQGQTFIPADMSLAARLVLTAVIGASGAVMFKMLLHLRRLADNYSRREIFTTDSARQIRQFGIGCILWGLIKLVWAFLPLVISAHRLSVYSTSIDPVLIGAAIVAISWFAEMAAGLREENELTI